MAEFMEEKPQRFKFITAEKPVQKRPETDYGNGYEYQKYKYKGYEYR